MIKLIISLLVSTLWSHSTFASCSFTSKLKVTEVLNIAHLYDMVSLEAADCNYIRVKQESVDFVLSSETKKIHNGIRAEVAVNYPFKEFEQVNYQFDVKIPKGFKADAPQNRWWLLAQWHDQPDKTKGETWRDFQPLPPPIAVYLEERNGVIGIGLVTFGKNKESWFPFPLGEWLTLNIAIYWSTHENGVINFGVLERPQFNHKVYGRNMNNTFQHYLKLGQYRHPQIKKNSTVSFKNLVILKKHVTVN